MNLIIQTGIITLQIKTSVITSINELGNKIAISNFRPISLIKISQKYLRNVWSHVKAVPLSDLRYVLKSYGISGHVLNPF